MADQALDNLQELQRLLEALQQAGEKAAPGIVSGLQELLSCDDELMGNLDTAIGMWEEVHADPFQQEPSERKLTPPGEMMARVRANSDMRQEHGPCKVDGCVMHDGHEGQHGPVPL